MSKLLSNIFYKVRKDTLFPLSLIASAIFGIIFTVFNTLGYDDSFIVPIHILIAAFVSLICGREYNDGTIRNKVVSGHSKGKIYLATLVVNYGVALLIVVIFTLIHFVLRITVFPLSSVFGVYDWLLAIGNLILGCFVYTAIFTLVSMLVDNRSLGAIINLVLVIVMMIASYQVEFQLCQPHNLEMEYVEPVHLTQEEISQIKDGTYHGGPYQTEILEDGEVVYFAEKTTYSTEPNPRYVSNKLLRKFYEICDNALPHGQVNTYMSYLTSGIRFADRLEPALDEEQIIKVSMMPAYSLSAIVIFSLAGYLLFRKKELK